jgi:hypothetical protein
VQRLVDATPSKTQQASGAIMYRRILIAIDAGGNTGLDRLFLGSVAESVIRMAQRPVLMIDAN